MGISAYLYFETLKHVIALLLIMLVVFTVYSLVSNVIASDSYKKSLTTSDITPNLLSYEGFLAISLGSKQIHQTESDKISYTVQCWLGVAMIAIWIIAFGVIKLREREGAQEVDIESKTASDFTILIKNYPSRMSKEQLER